MGYGAWLTGSFFAAYTIHSENDLLRNDPDETAYKIIAGKRTHDATMATNLSGRGETAVWKGLMVGHDLDADKGATYGELLKGNAKITARLGAAVLADIGGAQPDTANLVDVELKNIINAAGKASRVPKISWTNLDLYGGSFSKGSEISGTFYDNGNEVVGEFNKMDILGAFGAVEYMDDTMTAAP